MSRETRTRTRNPEPSIVLTDEPASKGGRSLRKRPRVDYTFDQLDDTCFLPDYGLEEPMDE